jgi:hypothetical protein
MKPTKTAVALLLSLLAALSIPAAERWSEEKANQWYASTPWLVGCNFSPSTAINQLEMWQADTFDLPTIDRELGWAESLGFNSVRVFLHHLPFEQDREGLFKRMEQFLETADRHHVGVMFVLFDSVWDPYPKSGKQREPVPGLHNSGWVQCPGREDLTNMKRRPVLQAYVKETIKRFGNDRRVHVWDLFNEPDNTNDNSYGPKNKNQEPADKAALSTELLKQSFQWARQVEHTQPLSSGPWKGHRAAKEKLNDCEKVQLNESDVITFHTYNPVSEVKDWVKNLRIYNRPLICTEYMARPQKSTFDPVLGYFKEQKIGAYNWGFVDGKTNTIYPWDSWQKKYASEPPVWFHDVFRRDGTAYRPKEVEYIRTVAGKQGG